MRLSREQIGNLGEKVFWVLDRSRCIQIFPEVEESYQEIRDEIFHVLEVHFKEQQSFYNLAYRELKQSGLDSADEAFFQKQLDLAEKIAQEKGKSIEETPEMFDELGEKIQRRLWALDSVDFLSSESHLAHVAAKALKRFQRQNEQINELLAALTSEKYPQFEPYSRDWCLKFDDLLASCYEEAEKRLDLEQPVS